MKRLRDDLLSCNYMWLQPSVSTAPSDVILAGRVKKGLTGSIFAQLALGGWRTL